MNYAERRKMRVKTKKLVITFLTTEAVMALERACAKDERLGRIIPTPQQISSGCGLSWSSSPDQEDDLRRLMSENEIQFSQIAFVEMY